MSKTNEAKGTAPKSNTPLLIIGLVAIIAVVGGWYWFSTSKSAPKTNTNSTTANSQTKPKTQTIPPNAPAGANPPNQAGSPTASITLEEFADFQCGSCAAANPILNEIKSTYGSRIRFIFRNYPLSIAAHDKAYDAAVAAEAAGLQGKFWEMQNLLFTNQQAWSTAPAYKQMWKEYASKIGLDVTKWENDMTGMAAKGRVDADIARGKAAAVNSTPSLFLNGTMIPYAEMTLAGLKKIIDAELANAAPAANSSAPAANIAAPSNASNAGK